MKANSEDFSKNTNNQEELKRVTPDVIEDTKEPSLEELAELYRVKTPETVNFADSTELTPAVPENESEADLHLETEIANLETMIDAKDGETNPVVPVEGATTSNEVMTDISSSDIPPEEKSTMTAEELRYHYDNEYRKDVARRGWSERGELYKTRNERREKYNTVNETLEIEQKKDIIANFSEDKLEKIDQDLDYFKRQTKNSLFGLDIKKKHSFLM